MNKIVGKEHFSENVVKFEVEAPLIAKSRKAGHFVIVRVGEKGERIPLTIADADVEKGTITLVVQKIGVSTTRLCALNVGDEILLETAGRLVSEILLCSGQINDDSVFVIQRESCESCKRHRFTTLDVADCQMCGFRFVNCVMRIAMGQDMTCLLLENKSAFYR